MTRDLPIGHDLARDPFDVSREVIIECAQRASMYALMVMDLAAMRDDDGAQVMARRLATEVNGVKMGFTALAEAHVNAPKRAADVSAGSVSASCAPASQRRRTS